MPSVASIMSAETPWDCLRCLQDVPKTPQTRPPGPPRRTQDGPPKTPWSVPEPPRSCLNSRRASQSLPGASPEPPGSLLGASWSLPEPPRSLPGVSQSVPGASLEPPNCEFFLLYTTTISTCSWPLIPHYIAHHTLPIPESSLIHH